MQQQEIMHQQEIERFTVLLPKGTMDKMREKYGVRKPGVRVREIILKDLKEEEK